MSPLAWQDLRKMRPYWDRATTPSWMRAPPESSMPTTGILRRMAVS